MKITKKRDTSGLGSYYNFKGKFIEGTVWWDGSGYLKGKEYDYTTNMYGNDNQVGG